MTDHQERGDHQESRDHQERTGVQAWRGQERAPAAMNVPHVEEEEEEEKEKEEDHHTVVTGSLRSEQNHVSTNKRGNVAVDVPG